MCQYSFGFRAAVRHAAGRELKAFWCSGGSGEPKLSCAMDSTAYTLLRRIVLSRVLLTLDTRRCVAASPVNTDLSKSRFTVHVCKSYIRIMVADWQCIAAFRQRLSACCCLLQFLRTVPESRPLLTSYNKHWPRPPCVAAAPTYGLQGCINLTRHNPWCQVM